MYERGLEINEISKLNAPRIPRIYPWGGSTVELDTLRISFSRTAPLGTFQVALFQIFYDVVVESLVFNFNPRKPSQSPVLFNTNDGIVLADGAREATEEEIIAEIRKFVSENFGEAIRKDTQ